MQRKARSLLLRANSFGKKDHLYMSTIKTVRLLLRNKSREKSTRFMFVIFAFLGISFTGALVFAAKTIEVATPPKKGIEPLWSTYLDRADFANPYAHIPAQCYIETSGGTQNACQYCHTDSFAKRKFGNNTPQAGRSQVLGNLIEQYAFTALRYPFQPNGSINPWVNTLHPEKLRQAFSATGIDEKNWDMEHYIRTDNWQAAYAQRPGSPKNWDGGEHHPFRLFPGLDPADLPAKKDGFVRSQKEKNGYFQEDGQWITGWRAINFVPYGIFTPMAGSVSGIYIRLPEIFMQAEDGSYNLSIYAQNLKLVAMAVQDRIPGGTDLYYKGKAAKIMVEPGLYPIGTEFAHPLHYVDLAADGTNKAISPFPGARSHRVKEIRYMYKERKWDPRYTGPGTKEEDAPVRVGRGEGWIDNGAGWLLAGYIEDKNGTLRPQTPNELVQCVGCHSGSSPQPDQGYDTFTSGTGNTVDSTWAMPRMYAGQDGWQEMDMMGYRLHTAAKKEDIPGHFTRKEPRNRKLQEGEFRYFFDTVVGVSLFGEMPAGVEAFLSQVVKKEHGYSADWPAINLHSPGAVLQSQKLRQELMREMTAKGAYLTADKCLQAALFLPTQSDALEGARRYRLVVATQRYDFGKDVFNAVPFTFKYYRDPKNGFAHQDGRPYKQGELITDRQIDTEQASVTWGVGITPTLIKLHGTNDPAGNYEPLLDEGKE